MLGGELSPCYFSNSFIYIKLSEVIKIKEKEYFDVLKTCKRCAILFKEFQAIKDDNERKTEIYFCYLGAKKEAIRSLKNAKEKFNITVDRLLEKHKVNNLNELIEKIEDIEFEYFLKVWEG